MVAVGCDLALPSAVASLHGGRCSELPSLQRHFLASTRAKGVRRGQVVSPSMVATHQASKAPPQLRIFRGQELKGNDLQHVMTRPRIDFDSILHTVHKAAVATYFISTAHDDLHVIFRRSNLLSKLSRAEAMLLSSSTQKSLITCNLTQSARQSRSGFTTNCSNTVVNLGLLAMLQACWFLRLQDFPEPQLPAETVTAFETAFSNIHAFHEAQQKTPLSVETMPGVNCRRLTRPIGVHTLNSLQPLHQLAISTVQ